MEAAKEAFVEAYFQFLQTDALEKRQDQTALRHLFQLLVATLDELENVYAAQIVVYFVREPSILQYVHGTFEEALQRRQPAQDAARLAMLKPIVAAAAEAVPCPGVEYRPTQSVNSGVAKVGLPGHDEENVFTPEGAALLLDPRCAANAALMACAAAAAKAMATFEALSQACRISALAALGRHLEALPGVSSRGGSYVKVHLLRHFLLLGGFWHPDDTLVFAMSSSVDVEVTTQVALAFGNSARAVDEMIARRYELPRGYGGFRNEVANFLCLKKVRARTLLRAIAGDVVLGGKATWLRTGYHTYVGWIKRLVEWESPRTGTSTHALAAVAKMKVEPPSIITALRYSPTTDRFEGLDSRTGHWVHDGVTWDWIRASQLDPWARRCQLRPGKRVDIPPGDVVECGDDDAARPAGQLEVAYRQDGERACLRCAIQNGLNASGAGVTARRWSAEPMLLGKSRHSRRGRSRRRGAEAPPEEKRVIEELRALGGFNVKHVDPPRVTGGNGLADAAWRLEVLLEEAAAADKKTFFVAQLKEKCGELLHVVAIHGDLVHDSNRKWTVSLAGGEGLDACTVGGCGCSGVEAAIKATGVAKPPKSRKRPRGG